MYSICVLYCSLYSTVYTHCDTGAGDLLLLLLLLPGIVHNQ